MKAFVLSIAALCAALAVACGAGTPTTPAPAPSAAGKTPDATPCVSPRYEGEVFTDLKADVLQGGETQLSIQKGSLACYLAHEQLVGRDLPSYAAGSTKAVAGVLILNNDGSVNAERSQFVVDISSFESDDGQRDGFVGRLFRQSPRAVFVPRQVSTIAYPLASSGTLQFQMSGDMTINGVTKSLTWDVQAQLANGTATGYAVTTITFADFGMSPPRTALVLSVDEELGLRIDFQLQVTAWPAP